MTKRISTFAIMICLASSFAFASDKGKSASSDEATAATAGTAATSDNATQKDENNATQKDGNPCDSAKHTKKDKVKAKPAPSNQEEEFDRVLRGIYG